MISHPMHGQPAAFPAAELGVTVFYTHPVSGERRVGKVIDRTATAATLDGYRIPPVTVQATDWAALDARHHC